MSVNIAILGDLHGHITLAYRLLKRWELENNKRLSAIFQVGDFGAFPPPFKVDKATMRFFKNDPDELSFIDYYSGSEEADEILSEHAFPEKEINASMYFIKGNHEDFTFLEELPDYQGYPAAVDVYEKIHFLRSGRVYDILIGGMPLKVGCLGGINNQGSFHRNPISPFYTNKEFKDLCALGHGLDLFLSHDAPFGSIYENSGSKEILEIISSFEPELHFCGHYHQEGMELEVPGRTRSFQLHEVNFKKKDTLNKGCIAVIEISSKKQFTVDIVDEDWMKEFNKYNFREL